MKSRNLIIVLIALLVVLGAAYFFTSPGEIKNGEENGEPKTAGEITLRPGEEGKVGNLSIKMLRVKNDSRCPVNARCIQAGKASADVELKLGEIAGAATLDTGSSPYIFENYLIKLVDVKPENIAGQEIVQAEYVAVFSIEAMDDGAVKDEDGAISGNSGIRGFVMMGPICPVQRAGDESCNDKPVKTNIVIKDKKEDVVKSFESLDDGSFSVNLSPGNYVIYADYGGNGVGGAKPEYVTVEEGKFAEVTIRIDTGIR